MFTKRNDESHAQGLAPDKARGGTGSPRSASRVGPSIIGADMVFKGTITSEGTLQIDGRVEGDVNVNDITIGSSGEVIGEIRAKTLRVKGKVKGQIHASGVELENGANVTGDIIQTTLVIQPDARFEGQVKHANDLADSKADNKAGLKPASTTVSGPATTNGKAAPAQKVDGKVANRQLGT